MVSKQVRTADQTDAEIRTAVEAASDSNVFTDADHTKLDGIEASADVTDTTNVVAALTAGSNITIAADGTIAFIWWWRKCDYYTRRRIIISNSGPQQLTLLVVA